MPELALEGEQAAAGGPRRRRSRAAPMVRCCSSTRRPDRDRRAAATGMLKPVVGFRGVKIVAPASTPSARPRRVAVGTFDGVHLGHRAVIAGSDTVLTFDPHPLPVFAPQRGAAAADDARAQGGADRRARRRGAGRHPVRRARSPQRAPSEFVDRRARRRARRERVSVGENFRFGHRREGDPALLRADGRFETHVVPLLEVDGEIVSSSHIRGLVLGGRRRRTPAAARRPVRARRARSSHGDKRGRELGFPTANLVPDEAFVVPGHGVYAACSATATGTPAAVNVGVRPTFETGRGELIEAFLLDFDGDLYGADARIEFLKRLRGERRFETVEALSSRCSRDVEQRARSLAAQSADRLLPSA